MECYGRRENARSPLWFATTLGKPTLRKVEAKSNVRDIPDDIDRPPRYSHS